MSVRLLDRIRKYPARLRHVRRTRVLGEAGIGGMYITNESPDKIKIACFPGPANEDTQVHFSTRTSTGQASPLAVIPAGSSAEQVAALCATALDAFGSVSAVASGSGIVVLPVGLDVELRDVSVVKWVYEGGGLPISLLNLAVNYDDGVGTIEVLSDVQRGTDVTVRASVDEWEVKVEVHLEAGTSPKKAARQIAQKINRDVKLSADRKAELVTVQGQASRLLDLIVSAT